MTAAEVWGINCSVATGWGLVVVGQMAFVDAEVHQDHGERPRLDLVRSRPPQQETEGTRFHRLTKLHDFLPQRAHLVGEVINHFGGSR